MKVFLASPHSYPGMIGNKIAGGDGDTFIKQGDKAAMQIFMAGGDNRKS